MKLFKQRAVTIIRLHCFSFRVINHWNNLPQLSATLTSAFKHKVDYHWKNKDNQRLLAY